MNNLALTVALATAPSTAFAELRERPRFWFPLLLLLLTTVGLTYWYFSMVDIEWLKDAMFSSNPQLQEMDEEKRNAAMAMFGRGPLLWSSVITMFIFVPVTFLLEGLYLLVAAKVTKIALGFKHWFSLVCWTSLPMLLGTIVGAILLLMADNSQVPQYSVMAPLSLNELLLHVPEGGRGFTLFESLGIPFFLSCALMVVGVHHWSQRSWGFSATLVLLPWVLIYGIAAFISFR